MPSVPCCPPPTCERERIVAAQIEIRPAFCVLSVNRPEAQKCRAGQPPAAGEVHNFG